VRVPDGLCHHFDQPAAAGTLVQKTTSRHVITLGLSAFHAVEVVRTCDHQVLHSPRLAALVPKGGKYGYDLIAHVGIQTFLHGRGLQAVAAELQSLAIPLSSMQDLLMKFLYYLGRLHEQYAAPFLRGWFQQRGRMIWLMDATVEPGTPAYFGILEPESRLCLGAWKIATENTDEMAPCLREAVERFGTPSEVLHDLSHAMAAACETVWGEAVLHRVCHFHLLRDIGEELYAAPQVALRERVRQLKLQPRLKEQRRCQADWLRDHVEEPTELVLLLQGQAADVPADVLGRELLVAFHQWILDYANDGCRQGYPFDPYLLYFHRRVVRASAALERLLREPAVGQRAPQVLKNLSQMLQGYLSDTRVIAAADEFEQAWELFTRLRSVLRLSAQGESPLHDPYLLEVEDGAAVQESLQALLAECREKAEDSPANRYQTVLDHLDRYGARLFSENSQQRTTNPLEDHWCKTKRRERKRHGRKNLNQDFQYLPAEIMLVPNLENPHYVEPILGDLSQLPAKLAEAAQSAPPWTHWRDRHKPTSTGRLPRRLLRQENLIDKLVVIYDNHCQPEIKRAG
jgi:hypothetical protein